MKIELKHGGGHDPRLPRDHTNNVDPTLPGGRDAMRLAWRRRIVGIEPQWSPYQ